MNTKARCRAIASKMELNMEVAALLPRRGLGGEQERDGGDYTVTDFEAAFRRVGVIAILRGKLDRALLEDAVARRYEYVAALAGSHERADGAAQGLASLLARHDGAGVHLGAQ